MFSPSEIIKTFLHPSGPRRDRHSNNQEDVFLQIEGDTPTQERLERFPLTAIMEALTKTPPTTILNPFYDTYLKPELNSLQLWDHSGDLTLAQTRPANPSPMPSLQDEELQHSLLLTLSTVGSHRSGHCRMVEHIHAMVQTRT